MVFSVKKTKKLSQESIDRMLEKGFTETQDGFYIQLMQLGKKPKRGVSRPENRFEPTPVNKIPQLV